MNNYYRGKYAELIARFYMRLHGFKIVAKNFAGKRGTSVGEIDFVAKRKNLLVFAEVKQRTTLDAAAYAISYKQRQRLICGAQNFIKLNPHFEHCDIRFDAILVKLPLRIYHIKNAWMQ